MSSPYNVTVVIYITFFFSVLKQKTALGRCYNISQANLPSKLPKFAQISNRVLTSRRNYGIMQKGKTKTPEPLFMYTKHKQRRSDEN